MISHVFVTPREAVEEKLEEAAFSVTVAVSSQAKAPDGRHGSAAASRERVGSRHRAIRQAVVAGLPTGYAEQRSQLVAEASAPAHVQVNPADSGQARKRVD